MPTRRIGTTPALFSVFISWLLATGVYAQTDRMGTYRADGKTCTISVRQAGKNLSVHVFAWWGNQMQTHGIIDGVCNPKDSRCVVALYPEYTGTACQPTLFFGKGGQLKATFTDCSDLNVPPDFSGDYVKVTNLTTGDFGVTADKAYFYDDRADNTRRRGYVLRGDVLDIQVIYDATWGFAVFNNRHGQATSGYVKLTTLSKK